MEIGKFFDLNDRYISVGNFIIIMILRLGVDCNLGIGKENIFFEVRVFFLNGVRMLLFF